MKKKKKEQRIAKENSLRDKHVFSNFSYKHNKAKQTLSHVWNISKKNK